MAHVRRARGLRDRPVTAGAGPAPAEGGPGAEPGAEAAAMEQPATLTGSRAAGRGGDAVDTVSRAGALRRPLFVIGATLLASRLVALAGMARVHHGSLAAALTVAGLGWDSRWYAMVLTGGYAGSLSGLGKAAFYPGYPLLAAIVYEPLRAVTGRPGPSWDLAHAPLSAPDPLVAAALLATANLSLVAALVSLWHLYVARLGAGATLIGTCLLLCAPSAFFLSAGYAESTFLALSALAFLAAERGRWIAAGAATAASCLVRLHGVLLLVPLALIWLESARRRGRTPALAGLLMTLAGAGLFPAYTWVAFGDPALYEHLQASGWQHRPSNPMASYAVLLLRLWWGLRARLSMVPSPVVGIGPGVQVVDGVMLLWSTACAGLGRVRLGLPHAVWTVLVLTLPLLTGGTQYSMNRYLLAAFPAFFVTGWWLRRLPLLAAAIAVLSMAAMYVLAGNHASGRFVG